MSAASLLAQLRSAGVSVSIEDDRLIVDAPAGVVTGELRAVLGKYKAELTALLESGIGNTGDAANTTQARNRVARLLAIAYRRSVKLSRAVEDQAILGNRELANSATLSVHGVVP
jgi:TubC N-terminal docking domain